MDISNDKQAKFHTLDRIKRETESLLIIARNNTIRINNIKVKIDKMPKISKCGLCGDRDETINHIIS